MNIVLVEPEIPGNTGNIGRTCVGTGTTLHLVGRLGFSLNDKYLKRAGLDYWNFLQLKVYDRWEDFLKSVPDQTENFFFFEKDGPKSFWNAKFSNNSYLIFGSETKGFSENIVKQHGSQFYRIPMNGPIRSLNLSSTAAVALYEAIRQQSSV